MTPITAGAFFPDIFRIFARRDGADATEGAERGKTQRMLNIEKYSIGVGDRFAHQAKAQLRACQKAAQNGAAVVPVWNKSNREHLTIDSDPSSVRAAADAAVRELGWKRPYYVDADHIGLQTVNRFLPYSDFFTIDVAHAIGQPADSGALKTFADENYALAGTLNIPGIETPFSATREDIERIAGKYLAAVQEAGRIYRYIADAKGAQNFITEISMDETDAPQTPLELLVILAAIADEQIQIQTIAPKFTGRFNKGVDYVGDVAQFEREFNDDVAILDYAVKNFGLPKTLKLSVHSGSDKFSIYAPIRRALKRFDAGVHLKTAGTTWLEEIIGLAESGGDGLIIAKEVYAAAYEMRDALCAPYAAVIDIDPTRLPTPEIVNAWPSESFVAALRHDPTNPEFNPSLRQLIHVGYKVAAQMGDRYRNALKENEETVSRNVTLNLYERHLKPLFV